MLHNKPQTSCLMRRRRPLLLSREARHLAPLRRRSALACQRRSFPRSNGYEKLGVEAVLGFDGWSLALFALVLAGKSGYGGCTSVSARNSPSMNGAEAPYTGANHGLDGKMNGEPPGTRIKSAREDPASKATAATPAVGTAKPSQRKRANKTPSGKGRGYLRGVTQ